MAIKQLNSANTIDHWLVATQSLIATMNAITDGPSIESNSAIDIKGLNAQLNVRTSGSINTLYANTANIANILISESNIAIPGNIHTLNVSSNATIGGNITVHGNASISLNTAIGGNLTVSYSANVVGNVTANNLFLYGTMNAVNGYITTGNTTFGNTNVSNTLVSKEFFYSNANGSNLVVSGVATVNSAIGNLVYQIQETSFIYSLILG
jgi:NDP-sugar pyrophosphorylase family protein